jgi:MoaD family protein
MKTVLLPQQLRNLTNGEDTIEVGALTIGELIDELESRYNGFKSRLLKPDGTVNSFVNFYVNGEDIRFLAGINTTLLACDEISIVPAVAGG